MHRFTIRRGDRQGKRLELGKLLSTHAHTQTRMHTLLGVGISERIHFNKSVETQIPHPVQHVMSIVI